MSASWGTIYDQDGAKYATVEDGKVWIEGCPIADEFHGKVYLEGVLLCDLGRPDREGFITAEPLSSKLRSLYQLHGPPSRRPMQPRSWRQW